MLSPGFQVSSYSSSRYSEVYMAKRFDFLDPWFEERGFKRFKSGEPEYRKEVKPGVILQLTIGVNTLGRLEDYGVSIGYDVCLKPLVSLHRKLAAGTTRFEKLYPEVAGYVIVGVKDVEEALPWHLKEYSVEKHEIGPMWREVLDTIEPDLVELERQLVDAPTMQAVGDLPNWRIKWDLYGPILVALFDGDAGRAVELVDELTEREVNPNGNKTKEGRLTPAEEIKRAKILVREYIDKNKNKFNK